ncbi:hypothetical protein BDN67DRAFT_1052202 [Paxillus ammoniavirescens]|nr:hypothetical protein BDN67DRAFT_1052202 [Paxillus ammoniavirescens]
MTNEIFLPCVNGQNASTELVVFSREANQLVSIAYPLSKHSGEHILPDSIPGFLRKRRLYWECFCALLSHDPVPVRFTHDFESGHLRAVCHHHISKCGFSLDLVERRQTAAEESTYAHVRACESVFYQQINMPILLAEFHASVAVSPDGYADATPFFEGYCGRQKARVAVVTQHPATNAPRSLGPVRNQHGRRRYSAITHRPSGRCAAETTIQATNTTSNTQNLSSVEQDILHRLAMGQGITPYEEMGLIETCSRCNKAFMGSGLRAHIPTCARR